MSNTNFGVVRLTLYSLISAIETDLRSLITSNLLTEKSALEIFPPAVLQRARDRMDRDEGISAGLDESVVEYLDFSECIEVLAASKSLLVGAASKAVNRLAQTRAQLTPIRNRVMHSRPLEYDDFARVSSLSEDLLSYPEYLFPALRRARKLIKDDPTSVLSLDIENKDPETTATSHNLPIPDFDETGFLGRAEEETSLVKICKSSPWPIITILGEGGIGKSALALRVAYNLLDDRDAGFDAVVWSTSKTTKLTSFDIQKIDGAIQNSIGVFQEISRTLAGNEVPIDEILEYLNSFKILLVLDNLETILDESIRKFLTRIMSNSKVLITSRIGLGELEYRFPLSAMKVGDSVTLLRATAEVRRVEKLTKTNNATLRDYCTKMRNNPLFIKWFVSGVQSGKRPEEVLQNSKIFLDYCLSNVVEHLSEDALLLAKAMVAVSGPHAQPVLAYLTELSIEKLQLALQQLITANIALLITRPVATGYESLYDLAELPKLYLLKAHAPSTKEIERFGKRRAGLVRAHEKIKAQANYNPYSPNSVAIRQREDVVMAKYLTDAMTALRRNSPTEAIGFVEAAKSLAPGYSEVYRVEGWIQYFLKNYAAARESYETAIEIDPQSAALRYWYGGFLLRAQNDSEAASKQFALARSIDPDAPEIRVEYARALSYQYKFDEADEQIEQFVKAGIGSTKLLRVAYDGWIQIGVRRARFCMINSDFVSALKAYEEVARRFESIPNMYVDTKIVETVAQCVTFVDTLRSKFNDSEVLSRLDALWTRFQDVTSGLERRSNNLQLGESGAGEIARMSASFGFIKVDDGGDLFFHQSQLRPPTKIRMLAPGDRVKFSVGENPKGLVAEKIEVIDQNTMSERNLLSGQIESVEPGFTFGFIRMKDGTKLFFNRVELRSPKHMSWLTPGTPVQFFLGKNDKGPVACSVEQIYTSLLDDALRTKQRIIAPIAICKPGVTYAISNTAGGTLLIRSADFRDPAAFNSIEIGDEVSCLVELNSNGGFVGRDICVENKFWSP